MHKEEWTGMFNQLIFKMNKNNLYAHQKVIEYIHCDIIINRIHSEMNKV